MLDSLEQRKAKIAEGLAAAEEGLRAKFHDRPWKPNKYQSIIYYDKLEVSMSKSKGHGPNQGGGGGKKRRRRSGAKGSRKSKKKKSAGVRGG